MSSVTKRCRALGILQKGSLRGRANFAGGHSRRRYSTKAIGYMDWLRLRERISHRNRRRLLSFPLHPDSGDGRASTRFHAGHPKSFCGLWCGRHQRRRFNSRRFTAKASNNLSQLNGTATARFHWVRKLHRTLARQLLKGRSVAEFKRRIRTSPLYCLSYYSGRKKLSADITCAAKRHLFRGNKTCWIYNGNGFLGCEIGKAAPQLPE